MTWPHKKFKTFSPYPVATFDLTISWPGLWGDLEKTIHESDTADWIEDLFLASVFEEKKSVKVTLRADHTLTGPEILAARERILQATTLPESVETPIATAAMNFMQTSEWGQCGHCFTFFRDRNSHYCGAPWQMVPIERNFDHQDMPQKVGRNPFDINVGYCVGCGVTRSKESHTLGCPVESYRFQGIRPVQGL